MATFTAFDKYPCNPLDIPLNGNTGVVHPDVMYFPAGIDGYKYWMVYTPYPPEANEEPWIVRSHDGIVWTDSGVTNPVISKGAFDYVPDPCFLYNSTYSKWFMAYPKVDGSTIKIYLAYSTDGKSWTEYGELVDGSAAYEKDDGGIIKISHPTMIFEGGWFYIWYVSPNGAASLGNNRSYVSLAKFQWNNGTIAVENFTRDAGNPVLFPPQDAEFKSGCGHLDVSEYGGTYYMYCVRNRLADANFELALFTSTDKVSWTNQGKVLSQGAGGEWDDTIIYRTTTVTDGDGTLLLFYDQPKLYYSAYPDNTPRIGIATGQISPDFTINTTAHFNAGTKSSSGGNYETETNGSSERTPTCRVELASKMGDKFTLDDVDGDNWKGTPQYDTGTGDRPGAAGGSASIAGNKLSLAIAGIAAETAYGYLLDTTIDNTKDWIFQVEFENLVLPATDYGYFRLTIGNAGADPPAFDFDDMCTIYRQRGIGGNYRTSYIRNAASTVCNQAENETATSGKFRIKKVGTTVYCAYDFNGGWITLCSGTCANWANTLRVAIDLRSTTNYPDISVDVTQYYMVLPDGAMTSPYRTSGYWESDTQIMTTDKKMSITRLRLAKISATYYVDKIEWLVGGVVKATYDTNITSGTEITIENSDLTSGSFNNVNADFTIKLYLASDGDDLPVIEQIDGEYVAIIGAHRSPDQIGWSMKIPKGSDHQIGSQMKV